jgi:hypothetical protein
VFTKRSIYILDDLIDLMDLMDLMDPINLIDLIFDVIARFQLAPPYCPRRLLLTGQVI